jgi:hypothetical protein
MALSNESPVGDSMDDSGMMMIYAIKISRMTKASSVRWPIRIPATCAAIGSFP